MTNAATLLFALFLGVTAQAQSSSSSGLVAPPISGTPTTGTSAPSSSSLNSVCGSTLQEASNPTSAESGSSTFTQMVQYCKAAQQAQKAANDDDILWKAWAGVAGICTAACITSYTGAEHLGLICKGANIGTAVTSGILTQNLASSLIGLAPMAIGFTSVGKTSGTSTTTDANGVTKTVATKKGDLAACLSAATATIEVFTTRKDETSQQQTEASNLQAASQLTADASASSSGTTSASAIVPTSDTAATQNATSGTGTPLTVEKSNLAQTGSGSGNCSTPGFACALAMDSNLPAFVSGSGFGNELQKNSGLDPDQYMNSGQTPAQAILGASGGAGLDASGLSNYAGMLGDLAKQYNGSDPPVSVYASTGGGGAPTGAPDDSAALGSVMAGLMKQLNPNGEPKEKEDAHSLNVVFQQPTDRAPAYNADDPKLSLFDRVSFRYRYVSQRLER